MVFNYPFTYDIQEVSAYYEQVTRAFWKVIFFAGATLLAAKTIKNKVPEMSVWFGAFGYLVLLLPVLGIFKGLPTELGLGGLAIVSGGLCVLLGVSVYLSCISFARERFLIQRMLIKKEAAAIHFGRQRNSQAET
ncbi:MAG: hypothetical protein U9N57_01360 [Pseudomonadota bacterium]|nr:hypothetical protein [Pseudomonadota bacterium]